MVDEKTEIKSQNVEKNVSLRRVIPEDLPLIYSDGMVVKNQDGLFNLYFFQNRWPIAITPEELEAVETIEARCIAHLVMTPDQMKKSIDALVENFGKFEKRIQALIDSEQATRLDSRPE